MATEDHDLDEIRHATWFEQGKLIRFELPLIAETGRPVGRFRSAQRSRLFVQEAAGLLRTRAADLLAQYLVESYRPEETYGSAFGKLFARLFQQQGLILMTRSILACTKLHRALSARAGGTRRVKRKTAAAWEGLDRAGFDAQVKVTSRSTLLFHLAGGVRQVITASSGKFQSGEKTWTRTRLVHLTHTEPENFSPNALFRPWCRTICFPPPRILRSGGDLLFCAIGSCCTGICLEGCQ